MSVVRGRPPGFAGGISGTRRAYCSSLRACPAPKSPTKARLSAVHTARLQEGLPPSPTVSTAASPHARPDGRASQTASELVGVNPELVGDRLQGLAALRQPSTASLSYSAVNR